MWNFVFSRHREHSRAKDFSHTCTYFHNHRFLELNYILNIIILIFDKKIGGGKRLPDHTVLLYALEAAPLQTMIFFVFIGTEIIATRLSWVWRFHFHRNSPNTLAEWMQFMRVAVWVLLWLCREVSPVIDL